MTHNLRVKIHTKKACFINMHQNISYALVEMHDYTLTLLKVMKHLLECISNLTYSTQSHWPIWS